MKDQIILNPHFHNLIFSKYSRTFVARIKIIR